jgi:drug/metabolite transporter (DMT)-like permease
LWILKQLPPSIVSGFICLQSLIGMVLGHHFLKEPLRPSYGVAAGLIVGSVVLVSALEVLQKRRSQAQPSPP